ncbi:MAG: hypothetical protein J6Z08_00750 [Elusimicrobiales bacterium]|nr:hypothetical protein [Elusimicrobiales bacterium]
MLRSNPHIIGINTRLWLKMLREKYNLPEMTLSAIPDEEWLRLKKQGFDIVWLMGVWQPSPESERISRQDPALLKAVKELPPGFGPEALGSSPYSIYLYYLNPDLGFEWELKDTREKLNSMGMKLMLDIVSNHTSKDAPYVKEHPECFIQGTEQDYKEHPDWFFETEKDGKKLYIAYGRDPNFPAWKDTAQLNYFNKDTHREMLEALMRIAGSADCVRCDMVMLSLNDIQEKVWGKMLRQQGYTVPQSEFWADAIKTVKAKYPDFVFLAEVYWGLEWRLQEMGFDYTYDKITYDRLLSSSPQEIYGHLRAEKLYQKRSARFIDNHHEKPSLEVFGREKALAAATVFSTVRGLRLYMDNQISGSYSKAPLQMIDMYERRLDSGVAAFYERLLKINNHPAFHGGEWSLLHVEKVDNDNHSNTNILAWKWAQFRTVKLVIINYSPNSSSGIVDFKLKPTGPKTSVKEELSDSVFEFAPESLAGGIKLDMAPWQKFIFTVDVQ